MRNLVYTLFGVKRGIISVLLYDVLFLRPLNAVKLNVNLPLCVYVYACVNERDSNHWILSTRVQKNGVFKKM